MLKRISSHLFCWIVTAAGLVLLVGCSLSPGPATQPAASPFTSLPTNPPLQTMSVTPLVTRTVAPTYTKTPRPATATKTATMTATITETPGPPSPTPLPTLSDAQAEALALDLLKNNRGCDLPCWWGFVPGVTRPDEARDYFLSVGEIVLPFSSFGNEGFSAGFRVSEHSFTVGASFFLQEGVIDIISP